MKDIHVWLQDDEAERIAAIAKAEDRSLTNMVRFLAREALARRTDELAALVNAARENKDAT